MHVIICWVVGLYSASLLNLLPQVPPSTPLSSFPTFMLSHRRPAWIWAVKRSSRRVWLAHFAESLNIQGGLSFEAAPGSPFVSEAALFILTYAQWSLTWGKPQKNTSGTFQVLSPTLQHPLEIRVLMDGHGWVLYTVILWFAYLIIWFKWVKKGQSLLGVLNTMWYISSL